MLFCVYYSNSFANCFSNRYHLVNQQQEVVFKTEFTSSTKYKVVVENIKLQFYFKIYILCIEGYQCSTYLTFVFFLSIILFSFSVVHGIDLFYFNIVHYSVSDILSSAAVMFVLTSVQVSSTTGRVLDTSFQQIDAISK